MYLCQCTELTSLRKGENETTTDYIIRTETAATALKTAEEVINDRLLIAMVLKGLPRNYKTFSTVVIQREKQITFSEFKTALRNYNEMFQMRQLSKDTKVLNAG